MPKSQAPKIISHITPEHQQEAILIAVLNIQAHAMTMAGMLMRIHEITLHPNPKPGEKYPTFESYLSEFHDAVRTMQKTYAPFGGIDSL